VAGDDGYEFQPSPAGFYTIQLATYKKRISKQEIELLPSAGRIPKVQASKTKRRQHKLRGYIPAAIIMRLLADVGACLEDIMYQH
jgi:hypothetical protein